MSRPFCVGLTGGLASGKSEVAARFARQGAEVVDTDAIARQLTGPQGAAMAAIILAFGNEMLAGDGSLDRAAMRRHVFVDEQSRRRLETILHPLILAEAHARVQASQSPYVVLVVPLLVESWQAYREFIDRVLVVDCEESLQLQRAMARDAMDEIQARAMLAAQSSRQARLAIADDILNNQGDLEKLERQVEILHDRYLVMAKNRSVSLP